jgi:hypothetical protein
MMTGTNDNGKHKNAGTQVTGGTSKRKQLEPAEMRKEIRDALKRADLTIVKTVQAAATGDKVVGPMANKIITYQVAGAAVADPTKRYYMSTRLEKLSKKVGVHVELRRVRKNTNEVFVDVFPTEDDADNARKAEDLRRAENPVSPASKHYFRRKAGLVQPRGTKSTPDQGGDGES